MGKKINNSREPFGGKPEYRVAHEVDEEYLVLAINKVLSLLAGESSPILSRYYMADDKEKCFDIEIHHRQAFGSEYIFRTVEDSVYLSMTQERKNGCSSESYIIIIESKVEFATGPITVEYLLERFADGRRVTGKMRSSAFGELSKEDINYFGDSIDLDFNDYIDITEYDAMLLGAYLENIEEILQASRELKLLGETN